MSTRYGQLTYTSYDTAGSAGGWRVKQSTGNLSDAETELLVSGVRAVFRPAEPLPNYPSPEQLADAPRRLAYRRDGGGAAAYWHSAAAGADSTGRPGNVFIHSLLDRAPDTAPARRPVERWRSPGWLRPYGAAAVGAAALSDDVPADGPTVTKDAVIDFVLDTGTWRLGVLPGLLDAVVAARSGGPPLILAVASVDSAAQWIGAVSFLMAASTASTLNFSTFERAEELTAPDQVGQHLIAVPLLDVAALPGDAVVIDETATLSLGELGGAPHRTAAGQPIEVTAWSVLAQEALMDATSARRILDDIDDCAAQSGRQSLHPAWPLATVIAAEPTFAAAHPEAHMVLAAHPPGSGAGNASEDRTARIAPLHRADTAPLIPAPTHYRSN